MVGGVCKGWGAGLYIWEMIGGGGGEHKGDC